MNQEELNIICGERLRKCIEEKNMKQKDVAAAAHFTEQYISNMVRGKCKLTTDAARTLSKVLDVRMEYLLCEDDYKTSFEESLTFMKKHGQITDCLCKILDCKGYSFHQDEYTESEKPYKVITIDSTEIECTPENELNKLIERKLYLEDEQTVFALKHPDGRVIRISSKHFFDLLDDIRKYIDFKLQMEFDDITHYMLQKDMLDDDGNNIFDKPHKRHI